MAKHVTVEISIPGAKKGINTFHSLTIEQKIGAHHQFELRLPLSVLDPEGIPDNIYEKQHLMGEIMSVQFKDSKARDKKGNATNKEIIYSKFRGLITKVAINKHQGAEGDVVLSGYSPTIVLENGPHYASFSEKPLSDIVINALEKFQSNYINVKKINPEYKEVIPYSVQYNESTFNYLKRLANKYGEWFYYDGDELVMGLPKSESAIVLHFGQDVSDMNFELKIVPLNFKKSSYDYRENVVFTSESSSAPPLDNALGMYGKLALDEAASVFQYKTSFLTNSTNANQKITDTEVKTLKNQRSAEMMVLSGSSDNAALTIGATIDISATTEATSPPGSKKVFKSQPFGKYIITGVTHRTEGHGHYQNFFHAIPDTIKQPPLVYCMQPRCDTETAVVIDNKDPDGYGRLQVQTCWQSSPDKTPWLRSLSGYTGLNRGIDFNPEVGDEVLIGYNDNNPDNPIVTGSFKNKSSAYTNMDLQTQSKFITSRYNMIRLADNSDDFHGIGINVFEKDSDHDFGNHYCFLGMKYKSGKGTIDLEAKNKITIKAPSIELLGSEIFINGSKLIDMKSDKRIHAKAGEEINMESDMKITQKATTDFNINGMKVEMNAQTDFKIHGLKVEVKADNEFTAEGSVKAEVKGGTQLDMSSGAMATLKGAVVMIN